MATSKARTDPLLVVAGVLATLAIGVTAWILSVELSRGETMAGPGLIVMPADLGGPFALRDHHGREIDEAAFEGRPTLVTFGYSFCPDICPTTLTTMAEAIDGAEGDGRPVRGAFVTVDPERDTVTHLADYVPHFHEELVGLTGDAVAIDRLADAFRVRFRLDTDRRDGAYAVEHSAYIYLMDRDWRLIAVFRHDATADDMVAVIRRLL